MARDWQTEAQDYAETVGLGEYEVNGKFLEYWTFYSEGWYFVKFDLELRKEVFRGAFIPKGDDCWIPRFLQAAKGVKYNYEVG